MPSDEPPRTPPSPNPLTFTRVFLAIATAISIGTLATTAGGAAALLPLVLAPLLLLYWVSGRVRANAAAGWMIFGGGFVIVAPMLLFLIALSVQSIRPTDGQGALGFGLMLMLAPFLQLLGVGLLYLIARLISNQPGTP